MYIMYIYIYIPDELSWIGAKNDRKIRLKIGKLEVFLGAKVSPKSPFKDKVTFMEGLLPYGRNSRKSSLLQLSENLTCLKGIDRNSYM